MSAGSIVNSYGEPPTNSESARKSSEDLHPAREGSDLLILTQSGGITQYIAWLSLEISI
jgi:hypothetical protein